MKKRIQFPVAAGFLSFMVVFLITSSCLSRSDQSNATPSSAGATPTREEQMMTSTPEPTISVQAPTLTPFVETQESLPDLIPIPETFVEYDSLDFEHGANQEMTNFTMLIPEEWVTGWLMDSGIIGFITMREGVDWQDPLAVMLMVIVNSEIQRDDLLLYAEDFAQGSLIEGPSETPNGDNNVYSAVYSDGKQTTISAVVWRDEPTRAVFILGYMPTAYTDRYRPLIEELIYSVSVGEEQLLPDVFGNPYSGPIPTEYTFYFINFQPNEIITIEITQPDYSIIYEKIIFADEQGMATLTFTSEGEAATGQYRLTARGNKGGYAQTVFEVQPPENP